jgi:hypothetical protein
VSGAENALQRDARLCNNECIAMRNQKIQKLCKNTDCQKQYTKICPKHEQSLPHILPNF